MSQYPKKMILLLKKINVYEADGEVFFKNPARLFEWAKKAYASFGKELDSGIIIACHKWHGEKVAKPSGNPDEGDFSIWAWPLVGGGRSKSSEYYSAGDRMLTGLIS